MTRKDCKYRYGRYIYGNKWGSNDPDDMAIVRAIYVCLWGHIYDIVYSNDDKEKTIGPWGKGNNKNFPFRGDTINSYNTIFGKDNVILSKYKIDSNLHDRIALFSKKYHSIGNFILIPNRENVNRNRAIYTTMQDYFDWFLIAIYNYQQHLDNKPDTVIADFYQFKREASDNFEKVLANNPEYKKWNRKLAEKFFLDKYYIKNKPYNYLGISLKERSKEHPKRNSRVKYGVFSNDEYIHLARQYLCKANIIIEYRAEKMIEKLKNELKA